MKTVSTINFIMASITISIPWFIPLVFYLFLLLQDLVPTLLTVLLKGFTYIEVIPSCIFCLYMAYLCFYKVKTREIAVFSLDGFFLLLMIYYLLYVVPMVLQLWSFQYSEYTLTGGLEIPPKSLTKYYLSLLFVLFIGRANCMKRRAPLKKKSSTPLKGKGGSKIPSTGQNTPSKVQEGPLAQDLVQRTVESTIPVAVGTSITIAADRFLTHGFLGVSKPTGPAALGLAGKKLASVGIGALAGYGAYLSLSESGRRVAVPRDYPGLTDKITSNPDVTQNNLLTSEPVNGFNASASGFIDEVVGEGGSQSPKFKLDEFDFPAF
jgi:hypothetical protein